MTQSRNKGVSAGHGRRWSAGGRGILLCVLVGAFLGTSGWTFHTGRGTSYFSNDPTACVNCHIMRDPFDAWQNSSHHTAAVCNDCHVSQHPVGRWVTKADNGFRHSWAFTFQDFHEPIQLHPRSRRVLHQNCLRCHGDFVEQIVQHTDVERDPNGCIRCHRSVGHAGN